MRSIFISCGLDNQNDAQWLAQQLEKKDFEVWRDATAEQSTTNRLDGVKACGVFLILMTPLATRSARVQRESLHAASMNKPILPVLLKGEVFPEYRELPYIDMRDGLSVPGAMVKMLRALLEGDTVNPVSFDSSETIHDQTAIGQPQALRELAKIIRANLGGNQPRGVTQEMQKPLLPTISDEK